MAEPNLIDQRDVLNPSSEVGDLPLGDDLEIEIETEEDLLNEEDLQFLATPPGEEDNAARDFDENLAEYLDDEALEKIASIELDGYENDLSSREEWDEIIKDAVNLLGFKVRNHEDELFDGSATVSHPLLAEAVVKFQAKAFKELFPSGGPCKTQVIGSSSQEIEQQAARVRNYMNYQTLHQIQEYGDELDRLLFHAGLYGSAFKKLYYDGFLDRPVTEFVKANDLITNYDTISLERAVRFTHRMDVSAIDMQRRMASGLYRTVEIEEPSTADDTNNVKETEQDVFGLSPSFESEYYEVLEIYDYLSIEDDPYGTEFDIPYIITIEKESQKVLSLRRNWRAEDERFEREQYFVHYKLIPGLNFYGYGYLHLIGGLAKASTGVLRQLLDAGTFASLPAGFKAHGLRVLSPDEPLSPGEWRDVNAPAADISKALLPLPYKEPSRTLLELLGAMGGLSKEFADASDVVAKDSANYGPVGTTLMLMEQSAKMYSAIHKRMHSSLTKELKLLARINADTLPEQVEFAFAGEQITVKPEDFDLTTVDVIPVSDPNIPTEGQRISKLNTILSMSEQTPQAFNGQAIKLELLSAMGFEKPERFLAQQQKPLSADPITENAAAMVGKPLMSTYTEAHDAHLAVHAAALNNPVYAENSGMRTILVAHINDTLAKKFTVEMLQLIGDPQLQQAVMSGEELPPELQNQIAIAAADAADTLHKIDEAKADVLNNERGGDEASEILNRELDIKEASTELQHFQAMERIKEQQHKRKLDDENRDLDRQFRERQLQVTDENKDLDRAQRERQMALNAAAAAAKKQGQN
jgi:hypothetical protein